MIDQTFLQFSNREEYISTRERWRAHYRGAIQKIREIKLDVKQVFRDGGASLPHRMLPGYWQQRQDLDDLAETRAAMKVRAQQQWQAERDAKQHQRGVTGMLAAAGTVEHMQAAAAVMA